MNPFTIHIQQVAEEMRDYAEKLNNGIENIVNAQTIETSVTPREVVYSEDKVILYHYPGTTDIIKNATPLLIVYAQVNRPYIADLQQGRSTIAELLKHGQDVYLLDWGYPDDSDSLLTMDDYINGYLDHCVDQVCKHTKTDKVNILGICQGGSFSLCYTSLHQTKVQNLITMVTPVDFKTADNLLSAWAQHIDIDSLVDSFGNIPGEMLNWTFLSLKPFSLAGEKYIDMVDVLTDEQKLNNFLRMEKWIFDCPDQAGETFRQFIKDFYQNNRLLEGGVKLGEKVVDLKKITCPILNLYAEQDHLVPPDASKALNHLTSSPDYTERGFAVGHIGIYVSAKAQSQVVPVISDWLNKRA